MKDRRQLTSPKRMEPTAHAHEKEGSYRDTRSSPSEHGCCCCCESGERATSIHGVI